MGTHEPGAEPCRSPRDPALKGASYRMEKVQSLKQNSLRGDKDKMKTTGHHVPVMEGQRTGRARLETGLQNTGNQSGLF